MSESKHVNVKCDLEFIYPPEKFSSTQIQAPKSKGIIKIKTHVQSSNLIRYLGFSLKTDEMPGEI